MNKNSLEKKKSFRGFLIFFTYSSSNQLHHCVFPVDVCQIVQLLLAKSTSILKDIMYLQLLGNSSAGRDAPPQGSNEFKPL